MSDEDWDLPGEQPPVDDSSSLAARLIGHTYQRSVLGRGYRGRGSEMRFNASRRRGSPLSQNNQQRADNKMALTPRGRGVSNSVNLRGSLEFLRSWDAAQTSWTTVPPPQENFQPPVYGTRSRGRLGNASVRTTVEMVPPWNEVNSTWGPSNMPQEDFRLNYSTRSRGRLGNASVRANVEMIPHWNEGEGPAWEYLNAPQDEISSQTRGASARRSCASGGRVNVEIVPSWTQREDPDWNDVARPSAIVGPSYLAETHEPPSRRSNIIEHDSVNVEIQPSWSDEEEEEDEDLHWDDVGRPPVNVGPTYLAQTRGAASQRSNIARGGANVEVSWVQPEDPTWDAALENYGPNYLAETREFVSRRSNSLGRTNLELVMPWNVRADPTWNDVTTSPENVRASYLAQTRGVTSRRSNSLDRTNLGLVAPWNVGVDQTWENIPARVDTYRPNYFPPTRGTGNRRSTSEGRANVETAMPWGQGRNPSWTEVTTPQVIYRTNCSRGGRGIASRRTINEGRSNIETVTPWDPGAESSWDQATVTQEAYRTNYSARAREYANRRSISEGGTNFVLGPPWDQEVNTCWDEVTITPQVTYRTRTVRGHVATTNRRSISEGRTNVETVTPCYRHAESSWDEDTVTQEDQRDNSAQALGATSRRSRSVGERLNIVEIETPTDEEVPSENNFTTLPQEAPQPTQSSKARQTESSEASGSGGQRSNSASHLIKDPLWNEIDSSWGDVAKMVPKKAYKRRPGPNDPYTAMNVPSNMVGRIIGRGGSRIDELQNESGTQIFVQKDKTTAEETIIKIYGDEESIAKAQELIDEVITHAPGSRHSRSRLPDPPQLDAVCPKINLDPDEPFDWAALNEQCEQAQKERLAKLPKLIKNFYKEDPVVANFTAAQVVEIRYKNNKIVVSRVFEEKSGNTTIKNPIVTFDQAFRHYPGILAEIKKAGFSTPSPIQCQAWPLLLSGEDIIGIAQTGTGKTLAFLLPALIHIDGQELPRNKRGGPNVLVLAPTRELALQIKREVDKYQYKGIRAVCLYGGGDRREQVQAVTKGVEIIIATPGRLNDLVMCNYIDVSSITYLVLDEADRMLDMGFEPQIRKILLDIRPDRQTVMTSATWPSGVRRLAQSYMDNPVQIYVGSLDLAAVHTVTQTIIIMEDSENEKFETLIDWVRNMSEDFKAIIFCGKKTRADYISSELVGIGINCQSIHGDRDQSDREQALIDIADGSVKILVATDVASRGLDIQDITHVINYDFPRNIEEYVHRVGRTGRAGRTGESITYMTKQDWSHARELINILQEADQFIPDELERMAHRYQAMKERRAQERTPRDGGGRDGDGRAGRGGGNRRGGGSFKGRGNVFYEEFDGFSCG